MPVILIERIPLPSLRTYTAISVCLLACSLYYAHNTAIHPENFWKYHHAESETNEIQPEDIIKNDIETAENLTVLPNSVGNESTTVVIQAAQPDQADVKKTLTREEYLENIMLVLLDEAWCIWTLINMAYCCLILIGKAVQKIVFGELRVIEKQHVKDKFWNFVFYKFILVFGVLNAQELDEVLGWCAWFSVLCLLLLLAQLSKDRFEYLSFSPTTPVLSHLKVITLLLLIQMTAVFLLVVSGYVGYYYAGIHTLAFMVVECFLLMVKTTYVLVRYAIHLWDMNHEGVWENRASYIYHAELIFELSALSIDFVHHIHMLIWGNIILSMASLVISMQLRFLINEFQRRIVRHKNYLRVLQSMEAKFPMATREELESSDRDCAVCWEAMERARKLPCGHLFHNACLRSWLEQDTSCPTCRASLNDLQRPSNVSPASERERPRAPDILPQEPANNAIPPGAPNLMPNMTNHSFHFDGSRYVSWLPSFSLEVHHPRSVNNANTAHSHSSVLDNMARQVREVFPHMPMAVILEDLRVTRALEITIENIIMGRVSAPPNYYEREDSESSSSVTSDPELMQREPADQSESLQMPSASAEGATAVFDADSNKEESPPECGGRFSKSSSERETMLEERKSNLLQQAQRNYIMKRQRSQGQSQTGQGQTSSSSFSDQPQRERVLSALQRRLNLNSNTH